MRTITMDEAVVVSGGGLLADSVANGAAIGTVAGVAGGYLSGGTLTAAAVGGAGFAVIGGALGGAFAIGYGVGTVGREATIFLYDWAFGSAKQNPPKPA